MTRTRKRSVRDISDDTPVWRAWRESKVWSDAQSKCINNIVVEGKSRGSFPSLPSSLRGQQTTVDENHGSEFRSMQKGTFSGDIGGAFSSTKSWISADWYDVQRIGPDDFARSGSNCFRDTYYGPVFAISPNSVVIPTPSYKDLTSLGTTAIARCKPTNNIASLATSITELFREGLPAIGGIPYWKERTNAAKGLSDEVLNSEFGWAPLVGDVQDVAFAAANAHEILESYERNSGKVVRRGYVFPEERTTSTTVIGPNEGYYYSPYQFNMVDTGKPMPNVIRIDQTFRKIWFSGAFTYHLPINYKSRNKLVSAAAKAGPLLGLELTPEVIWNLTPWTWAIDWFSNTGDVISNLSDWSQDGLVLKWGYIMEHLLMKSTYALDKPCRLKPYGTVFPSPVTAYFESKRRVKATPFGFKISWLGMTPRQLAISAALGITRVF